MKQGKEGSNKGGLVKYKLSVGWVTLTELARSLELGVGGRLRLRAHLDKANVPYYKGRDTIFIPIEFAERIAGLKSDPLNMVIDPIEFRYNASEAARILGVSPGTVRRSIFRNPLLYSLCYKRGPGRNSIWQIPASVVRVLLDRLKAPSKLSIRRGLRREKDGIG